MGGVMSLFGGSPIPPGDYEEFLAEKRKREEQAAASTECTCVDKCAIVVFAVENIASAHDIRKLHIQICKLKAHRDFVAPAKALLLELTNMEPVVDLLVTSKENDWHLEQKLTAFLDDWRSRCLALLAKFIEQQGKAPLGTSSESTRGATCLDK